MIRPTLRRCLVSTLACLTLQSAALAQPTGEAKEAARHHFEEGKKQLDKGNVQAALDAFLASRAKFATRGNTFNAAVAMRRLGRFDEARPLFEAYLKDFELSADERAEVQSELQRIDELLGSIELNAPDGAVVSVDGRERGTTPLGAPIKVPAGNHLVELTRGEERARASVQVVAGSKVLVTPNFETSSSSTTTAPAEQTAAPAQAPGRVGAFAEVDLGPSLGLLGGGDLASDCGDGCSRGLPFGARFALRGGATLAERFDIGGEITGLHMAESVTQRADTLDVVGRQPYPGITNDVVKWNAIGVGAVGGVRVGPEKIPVLLRLGLGVMIGSASDRRNGSYTGENGLELAQAAKTTAGAHYLYAAPEARVGYKLTDALSIYAGVRGTFLFGLSTPHWDTQKPTVVGNNDLGAWKGELGDGGSGERYLGAVRLLLDPSVSARYDF